MGFAILAQLLFHNFNVSSVLKDTHPKPTMFPKTDPSYFDGPWTFEKTEHTVLGLCKTLDRYAHKLTLEDLQNDPRCAKIPNLTPIS